MENRSEFHSTDDLATEQFERPSLDSIDSTIPAQLYTAPYEQVEVDHEIEIDVEVERAALSISASHNLVAPEKTAKRRRQQRPLVEVSMTTMVFAAVAGAGAFILGVVVASMVL